MFISKTSSEAHLVTLHDWYVATENGWYCFDTGEEMRVWLAENKSVHLVHRMTGKAA